MPHPRKQLMAHLFIVMYQEKLSVLGPQRQKGKISVLGPYKLAID
jgi:hypothetical protein